VDRRSLEILRAADDNRLYLHVDCGELHASYDNAPEDRYDGSLCTDEVNDLMAAGLLRCTANRIHLTRRGETRLARAETGAPGALCRDAGRWLSEREGSR
jgi:hypothetical protein